MALVSFGLIGPALYQLLLVNASISDDTLVRIGQCGELKNIEHMDVSENLIEKSFPAFLKLMRDQSDHLQRIVCCDNPGMKNSASLTIPKSKNSLQKLTRLDLSGSLKGDEQVLQLAQSSCFKNLRYLSLKSCKVTSDGFNRLLTSKFLRSLEVLVMRHNYIKHVEGPFGDLDACNERQLGRDIMLLKLLDLRDNKLGKIFLREAANFLEETVVLLWNNPFAEDCESIQ